MKCRTGTLVPLILFFVLALSVSNVCAHWTRDGIVICSANGTQAYPEIVSDGLGAVIIAWWDLRNGNEDVYAQKVQADGQVLWTRNGNPVCLQGNNQLYPQIATDGHGGAIISWRDWRRGTANSDAYAQRINANGQREWEYDGVAICAAASHQKSPEIISDLHGGAIVTWYDFRSGTSDVYAQRVDSKGNLAWPIGGTIVCLATGNQDIPQIAPDGYGGAIIAWQDNRGGDWDIYAQRVDANGSPLWQGNGVPVCSANGDQVLPEIAADNSGGAIFAWQDLRDGNSDIYAQRVDGNGDMPWQPNGIAVCSASGNQESPEIIADNVGGLVIAWMDRRSGAKKIFAQRIDIDGDVLWDPEGIAVCLAPGDQESQQIISDSGRGAIITWIDHRNGSKDVFAQRVDANGELLWQLDGLGICTACGDQELPQLATDGSFGAIITWYDHRGDDYDIYAQRVTADGGFDYPCPSIVSVKDIPDDQGGKVIVSWNASAIDMPGTEMITHYTIWRSLSGPESSPMRFNPSISSDLSWITSDSSGSILRCALVGEVYCVWELIGKVDAHYFERYAFTASTLLDSKEGYPAWHYFLVSAHTSDPFVFYDSMPDSGYSLDNLAPVPPRDFAGQAAQGHSAIVLSWAPNRELDLSRYILYRGTSSDFVPGAPLAATTDTSFADTESDMRISYYKLSAIDIHGNESSYALLCPEDVTGEVAPKIPDTYFLAQNFPNPFNPSTTIYYYLPVRCTVTLEIFDSFGRLVSRVLDRDRQSEGKHSIDWSGEDLQGRMVSSGVYLYRLTAGKETISKKMVLLR